VPGDPTPEGFTTCTFKLVVKQQGVHTMLVRLGGEVMGGYYIPTELRTCDPSFGGEKEDAVWVADDLTGECECARGTIRAGGLCWRAHELLLLVILTPLVVLVVIFLVVLHRQDKKDESSWKIPVNKVNIDEPPVHLGTGTFGQVIAGKLGGRDVAIKRVYPTVHDMSQFIQFVKDLTDVKRRSTLTMDSNGHESPTVHSKSKSSANANDLSAASSHGRRWGQVRRASNQVSPDEGWQSQSGMSALAKGEEVNVAEERTRVPSDDTTAANDSESTGVQLRGIASTELQEPPTPDGGASVSKDSHSHDISGGGGSAMSPPVSAPTKASSTGSEGGNRKEAVDQIQPQSTDRAVRPSNASGHLHKAIGYDLEMALGTADKGGDSFSGRQPAESFMKKHIKRLSRASESSSSFDLERPDLLNTWQSGLPGMKPEDALRAQLDHQFLIEIRIVTKLKHPCLVSVLGTIIEPKCDPLLVLEVCENGSLADILQNRSVPMEMWMLSPIMKDVVRGMRYLHAVDPPIVHGDLRAAKIMIDTAFRAKIADYGFTQKRRIGLSANKANLAPELIKDTLAGPTMQSDTYAFGVLLCELFSRNEPYAGENMEDVMKQVADTTRDPPKRPVIALEVPTDIEDIIHRCWDATPANRPSFEMLDTEISRMKISGMNSIALKLQQQQQQTNNVMYDVFPKHIADQLLAGKKVAPEHKPVVTIFFSDIVGFTDISGSLSPEKVSKMLDRLYTKFDDLANFHDVFKVETIGDAYMAVTNLVKDQNQDHCARIARFGLAAIKAAKETIIDEDDPARGTVNIRVGFHTGPVVANVVGNKNPRYCLFGDTVNTSSRMESNSVMGRVHCTKRAADVLRRQAGGMMIEERGQLEIKGKGQMTTYWVNGEDSDLTEKKADKSVGTQLLVGITAFKTANNRLKGLRASSRKKNINNAVGNSTTVTMLQGRYKAKLQAFSAFTGMHRKQTAKASQLQAAAQASNTLES